MWSLCKCIMWHVSKCLSVYSFCPSQLLYHYFPSLNSLLTCPHDLIYLIYFFYLYSTQHMIYLLLQILCLSWKTFPNLSSTVGGLFPIDTTGQTVPPVLHSLPVALLHVFHSCLPYFPPPRDCLQSEAKLCIRRNTTSIFLDLVHDPKSSQIPEIHERTTDGFAVVV